MKRIVIRDNQPPLRYFLSPRRGKIGKFKDKISSIASSIISLFKQYYDKHINDFFKQTKEIDAGHGQQDIHKDQDQKLNAKLERAAKKSVTKFIKFCDISSQQESDFSNKYTSSRKFTQSVKSNQLEEDLEQENLSKNHRSFEIQTNYREQQKRNKINRSFTQFTQQHLKLNNIQIRSDDYELDTSIISILKKMGQKQRRFYQQEEQRSNTIRKYFIIDQQQNSSFKSPDDFVKIDHENQNFNRINYVSVTKNKIDIKQKNEQKSIKGQQSIQSFNLPQFSNISSIYFLDQKQQYQIKLNFPALQLQQQKKQRKSEKLQKLQNRKSIKLISQPKFLPKNYGKQIKLISQQQIQAKGNHQNVQVKKQVIFNQPQKIKENLFKKQKIDLIQKTQVIPIQPKTRPKQKSSQMHVIKQRSQNPFLKKTTNNVNTILFQLINNSKPFLSKKTQINPCTLPKANVNQIKVQVPQLLFFNQVKINLQQNIPKYQENRKQIKLTTEFSFKKQNQIQQQIPQPQPPQSPHPQSLQQLKQSQQPSQQLQKKQQQYQLQQKNIYSPLPIAEAFKLQSNSMHDQRQSSMLYNQQPQYPQFPQYPQYPQPQIINPNFTHMFYNSNNNMIVPLQQSYEGQQQVFYQNIPNVDKVRSIEMFSGVSSNLYNNQGSLWCNPTPSFNNKKQQPELRNKKKQKSQRAYD